MDNLKPEESLNHIREMMSKSGKFRSLSGYAVISAGILTLVFSVTFCNLYDINPFNLNYSNLRLLPDEHYSTALYFAMLLLGLSSLAGLIFTRISANKRNEKFSSPGGKNFIYNMAVPMGFALLFCIILFISHPDLVLPVSLILYGLTLFNAGKFTHGALRYLGISQMLLSLICLWMMNYHILIWTFGFGIVHIAFGLYMIIKPERD